MRSHYLDALELEDRANEPLADMEREDYINQINSLRNALEQFKEANSLLRSAMDSSNERNESQVGRLHEIISGLTDEIRSLRKEVSKQTDYNKRHNKMSFDKKSQKSSSTQDKNKSREEEKMDCDGSDKQSGNPGGSKGSASDAGAGDSKNGQDSSLDMTKVKSEKLNTKRGSRGPYTPMEAARVVRLKTRLDGHPEGMIFIGYKNIEEYNRISYMECTCFEVAIYEDEYGIRHEYYSPETADDSRRPRLNVVEGTPCTPEFLADMVVNRWMLHTPNHRDNIRMRMDKFTSSENSRNNWIKIGADMLKPLCEYIRQGMLKVKSVLNIDETWCRVRIKFKGDGTKLGKYYKKYIWVLVNKISKQVYFLYDNAENDSRGKRPITAFLGDFKGSIQSDGYVVYKHLSRLNPENEHLLCWAHVRSKFKFAADISLDEDAKWFVEQIGRLYMIEAENIMLHRTADEIKQRRSKKDVTDILCALHDKAYKMVKNKRVHYGDLMDKALHYMLNGWDELLNYRKDGRYSIDNLVAERAIRPFTVNRKNSLFYSSEEGVGVATTFLTVIETAKMWGLEVRDYLVHVFREIMNGNKDCVTYAPEAFLT